MKDFKSKCACSAGGIGICLCIIFMSLAIVGTTAVGISKNADMGNMMSSNNSGSSSSMSSMSSSNSGANSNGANNSAKTSMTLQDSIINFFSGTGGHVILLVSYSAMFVGVWFSRSGNRKILLPIAVIGAAILYISMYNYYSIALEILGILVLAFAYASTFSYKVARTIKLA